MIALKLGKQTGGMVGAILVAACSSGCISMPWGKTNSSPTSQSFQDVLQASHQQKTSEKQSSWGTPVELPDPKPVEEARPGEPARLTVAWNNQVAYAADPTHGGDLHPGLIGRMYIFGPDPKQGEVQEALKETGGSLRVELWLSPMPGVKGQSTLKEVWEIDPTSLAKMAKRDIVGDGFSIFLPWSTYQVDSKYITLITQYRSKEGRMLQTAPEKLSLDHSATLQQAANRLSEQGTPVDGPRTFPELTQPKPLDFPTAPNTLPQLAPPQQPVMPKGGPVPFPELAPPRSIEFPK
jgi:hypothetical protein